MIARLATVALLCAAISACRDTSSATSIDCATQLDCGSEEVCFFGRCADPGYSIDAVYLDVTPPSSSGLLAQTAAQNPRQLSEGLRQHIELRTGSVLSGTVRQPDGVIVPGTLRAIRERHGDTPALPSQTQSVISAVDPNYRLEAMAGDFTLLFEPTQTDDTSPRPPHRWQRTMRQGESKNADFAYPDNDEHDIVQGTLVASSPFGTPQTGAIVQAFDTIGPVSSRAITNAAGEYIVAFSDAEPYTLTARPSSGNVMPTVTRTLKVEHDDASPYPELEPFVLGFDVPRPARVFAVTVNREAGQALTAAHLLFDGRIGDGVYHTSVALEMPQDERQERLIPGLYQVTAVPPRSDTGAMTTTTLCISRDDGSRPEACLDATTDDGGGAGCTDDDDCLDGVCSGGFCTVPAPLVVDDIDLTVATKIRVSGAVRSASGKPVADARLTLRLLGYDSGDDTWVAAASERVFSAVSSSAGLFDVRVDPGRSESDAIYELLVEPQQVLDTPLPRHRQLIRVNQDERQDVSVLLYRGSLLHGVVRTPEGRRLGGAAVAVYSVELGTMAQPLLVGLGQSNEDGEYVIAVPTLNTE